MITSTKLVIYKECLYNTAFYFDKKCETTNKCACNFAKLIQDYQGLAKKSFTNQAFLILNDQHLTKSKKAYS